MAWWKHAEVGMPVVALRSLKNASGASISRGHTYIIREVVIVPICDVNAGRVGLRLQGLTCAKDRHGNETGFLASNFRPAQSTDLREELTQLLDQPVSEQTTLKVGA